MIKKLVRVAFALALSITAMPILVNGQPQSLSSVNQDNSSNKSALKDSVKDTKAGVSQLIEAMIKDGDAGNISSILAPVIGLPKTMPMMSREIVISTNGSDFDRRACWVVYEESKAPSEKEGRKRPVCAYVLRAKREGLENQVQYFRIDLSGKLEKAILSRSKASADGKVVRGSGIKTDLDIGSPDVNKTFESEMKFWLKDWLKKQQKVPAKKA